MAECIGFADHSCGGSRSAGSIHDPPLLFPFHSCAGQETAGRAQCIRSNTARGPETIETIDIFLQKVAIGRASSRQYDDGLELTT